MTVLLFTIAMCLVVIALILIFAGSKTVSIVIARYNEDLKWLRELDLQQFCQIYIYNKGVNRDFFAEAPNIKVIDLPNVGREAHTYLHHIVTHYEDIEGVTIFLPGSANEESDRIIRNKWYRSKRTIDAALQTYDSVFVGKKVDDLKGAEYNFEIDKYTSDTSANREMNPESDMELSPLRPYGKWYEHYFGDVSVPVITYTGIFAVSKKHIRNRPRQFYQSLMSTIDNHSNVEVAHYMERSYAALFYPISQKNIYFD